MSQLDPFLIAVGTLGVLVFIVTSMFGMGLNLTIPQIMAPLKNTRLVLLALIANFIVVPVMTLLIVRIIPLSEGLQIGLILAGFAAGAPFLPKLIQVAKGDMAFTAGIMVLLMVLTVYAHCSSIRIDRSRGQCLGYRQKPHLFDAYPAWHCSFHSGKVRRGG
jgi:predicted Na+-dependent transporter